MFRRFSPAVKRESSCTVGTCSGSLFSPSVWISGAPGCSKAQNTSALRCFKTANGRGRGVEIGGRGRRRRDEGKREEGEESSWGRSITHMSRPGRGGPTGSADLWSEVRLCVKVFWREGEIPLLSEWSNLYWQVEGADTLQLVMLLHCFHFQ